MLLQGKKTHTKKQKVCSSAFSQRWTYLPHGWRPSKWAAYIFLRFMLLILSNGFREQRHGAKKKKKNDTKLRTQDQMASQIGAERARTQREGRGASDRWGGGGGRIRRGKSSGETSWGAPVRGGSRCRRVSHSKADVLSRRPVTARSQPAAELCMTRSRHETRACKPNEWERYIVRYIHHPKAVKVQRDGVSEAEVVAQVKRVKQEDGTFMPLPPSQPHLPHPSPNF